MYYQERVQQEPVTKLCLKLTKLLQPQEEQTKFPYESIEEEEAKDLAKKLERDLDFVKIIHERLLEFRVILNPDDEQAYLEKEQEYINDVTEGLDAALEA